MDGFEINGRKFRAGPYGPEPVPGPVELGSERINYGPGGKTVERTPIVTHKRKYLLTLAELIDRLSIVQLKEIFIPEARQEYRKERELIEHDIDQILGEKFADGEYRLSAKAIHAVCMIMLTNRFIWENESRARQGGSEQDKLLKLTHSINGVRNSAKNVLARDCGDRLDHKIDCFAAELVEQFGNWNVFE